MNTTTPTQQAADTADALRLAHKLSVCYAVNRVREIRPAAAMLRALVADIDRQRTDLAAVLAERDALLAARAQAPALVAVADERAEFEALPGHPYVSKFADRMRPARAAIATSPPAAAPCHDLRAHMIFSRRKALADRYGFDLTEQFNALVADVVGWAQNELSCAPGIALGTQQAAPAAADSETQAKLPPCQGLNCGATDGVNHSAECMAEHTATVDPGVGDRRAEFRHAGYKGEPFPAKARADEQAAWVIGLKARLPTPAPAAVLGDAGIKRVLLDWLNAGGWLLTNGEFDGPTPGRDDLFALARAVLATTGAGQARELLTEKQVGALWFQHGLDGAQAFAKAVQQACATAWDITLAGPAASNT